MAHLSDITEESHESEDDSFFRQPSSILRPWPQQDPHNVPVLRRSDSMDGHWSPYLRDLHMLNLSFLFIFLAYGATQNLETSLHIIDGLGSISLGILYLSLTISSLGAPFMVMWLGSKNALLLGLSGYWTFIVANLFPSWYTMIPASVFLGFTASVLWVAEGTYLTYAAKSHAAACNISEEAAIGTFNGRFWGVFASNQVIGNLISLVLLQYGKASSANPGEASPGTMQLFMAFLGSMTLGTVLACFLRPHGQGSNPLLREDLGLSPRQNREFVNRTFALLFEKKMLLLILVLIYTGLQQAFIWGDFTKDIITPAFGVAWVGGVMALYGAADAIGSLVAGQFSAGLGSIAIITGAGAAAQAFVIIVLYCRQEYMEGWIDYLILGGLATAWGVGDATFNTQISALLGILYPNDTEAAFAQWKIWQSMATSAAFFASPRTNITTELIFLLGVLLVSMVAFLVVTLRPERMHWSKW